MSLKLSGPFRVSNQNLLSISQFPDIPIHLTITLKLETKFLIPRSVRDQSVASY